MPQEVLVSSSLKVGQTMQGTVKCFVGRREERVAAPITLLSAGALRIGHGNDTRQIISTIVTDGKANHLVSAGAPAKEAVWLNEAQLVRATSLLREVTSILRPLASDGDEIVSALQILFDFTSAQRERNRPLRRFGDKLTIEEPLHVLHR
jgi:hypothetical protein